MNCPECNAPDVAGICYACVMGKPKEMSSGPASSQPAPVDPAKDLPALKRGDKIGGWYILSLIASGGHAVVYKVEAAGVIVATKMLRPSMAKRPEVLARLQREKELLQSFDHPNIVKVLDSGKGPPPWYAMTLVNGKSLRQRLDEGRVPATEATRIGDAVCSVVEYVHSKDVVHRDLKPANIILDTQGHVWLVDFGVAKHKSDLPPKNGPTGADTPDQQTEDGQFVGTRDYASPEQLANSHLADQRSDIYSLALILYEMHTGIRPPTIGKDGRPVLTQTAAGGTPPGVRKLSAPSKDAPVTREFDDAVLESLLVDPDLRPQSVAELRAALKEAAKWISYKTVMDEKKLQAWQIDQARECHPVKTRMYRGRLFLDRAGFEYALRAWRHKGSQPDAQGSQTAALTTLLAIFACGFLLAGHAAWDDRGLSAGLFVFGLGLGIATFLFHAKADKEIRESQGGLTGMGWVWFGTLLASLALTVALLSAMTREKPKVKTPGPATSGEDVRRVR